MTPKDSNYLEIAHQRAIEKKTHVSFPQLKYPSLRDEGYKDAAQWLYGKSMDDGAEGLWRIHNGIYNLETFINKHPGGSEWLILTKGTDITEAFETHHIQLTPEKMLVKYYVRDAKTPRNSPFTFKEDGFYKTLKNAVREELKKIPKDTAKISDYIIDILLVIALMSSTLSCWFVNYWLVMLSYVIASISLSFLHVAAHNYIHRKRNWRMYLFNLGLRSYRDFRVSHILSHHLYTNTLMDLEISGFEPVIVWNPRRNKPKNAFFAELIIYPIMFTYGFLKKIKSCFTRKDYYKNYFYWHDLIGLLLPTWMYITSGGNLLDVLVMWLWINCTTSFIFTTIGFNAAHHHPKIFKDGDEVSDVTPDWGMHELEAVMDRMDINNNYFKVLTNYGYHSLHHLFPTLDHAILQHLYPVFLEHCEKFKANFRLTTLLDLFIGQIKMTLKEEPTLLSEKE